ncbi:unnamed protein product [Mytilus edulis]|uniref:Transposase n=1 Tax=Mytilus edulis TaxID=6550 RepID=A0A8S3TM97_MYTED|nr:unnamed protein product [Mytilus edulis]
MQRTYLIPTIEEIWKKEQNELFEHFHNQDLVVLGDGRMDSPGHSAQYCSYTLMEMISKKILCIITMDKRMTERKSTNLEKACFKIGLQFLLDKGMKIIEVVTDAHIQVEALMKREYPNIKHSFDIWHGAKNLGKKVIKAGQEKGNKSLLDWTRDVVNHYWYSAEISKTTDESTAGLENFQNLILKYASKRHSYNPPSYRARNFLAALDHNANCQRNTFLNKDGSTRYQRYYSKKGGRWSTYALREDKKL